jgi:hypothetical protein
MTSLFARAAVACSVARELIETRGWVQQNYGYCNGPVCMVGALRLACGAGHPSGSVAEWEIFGAVHGALKEVTASKDIVAWNDATTRKREDVIAAFERAVQYLESRA